MRAAGFCPFHQWVYDSGGNCVAIPRNEAYGHCDVATGTMGLREVRTEVRLGFVFVNLDDDCEPLDDFLSGCLVSLEECLGTRTLEPIHFHRIVLNTNWKLWQLTNLEPYHEGMHIYNVKTNMSPAELHGTANPAAAAGTLLPGVVFAGLPARAQRQGGRGAGRADRSPGWRRTSGGWSISSRRHGQCANHRRAGRLRHPPRPDAHRRRVPRARHQGESGEDREMRIRHHNEIWGPFGRNLPEDNVASEIQMLTMREAARSSASTRARRASAARTTSPCATISANGAAAWGATRRTRSPAALPRCIEGAPDPRWRSRKGRSRT